MRQLREIIELASSDESRIVTILRKCLVVAELLRNESLREWVLAELNGYKATGDLPDYRKVNITAKGLLLGPMGAQINDQPLSPSVLDEKLRWWAETAVLNESISAYEALSRGKEDGRLAVNWPADLVGLYQSKFFKGYALNRAWQEIPIGAVIALVDTVQTRVLQFALELQRETGEDNDEALPSPEAVERGVQTIIFGGNNVFGSVGGDVRLIGQQTVVEGDLISLRAALSSIGVEANEINELEQAIECDKNDGAPNGLGHRVGGWLQKASKLVGKEGLKAGVGVAQTAATQAVLAYLGLNS